VTLAATPLAEDFPEPSREDWLKLVDGVLKGAPFDKRLVKTTADGIAVQPLYTADNSAAPSGPLTGAADIDRPWDLRSEIRHPDPKEANRQILQELENGAASVTVKIDPAGADGAAIASKADLATALEGVVLDLAPVALDAGYLGPQAADWLAELGKMSPNAPLALHMDPLSTFARTGASPGPIESHLILSATTAARWAIPYAKASFFLASGRVVHEAGGSEGQELGFALASALAYAKAMVRAGLPMDEAFGRIVLGLATDETYFYSLAKLRAARLLWAKLTGACGVTRAAVIEARSSSRMLSTLDPWVNLLRLTASGFAAGVAGANAVTLAPFTEPLGHPTDFARRQARNTQLVLMEESQLGRVADPAAGAWYLETLTDQMARAGWAAFQAIEAKGGIVAALGDGALQSAVQATRKGRASDIATRKSGLIGVSEFPILQQAPVDVAAVNASAVAKAGPKVQLPGPDGKCAPLAPWRLAESFEGLRNRALALKTPPKAALATLGGAKDFAARMGFGRNALAAGGIDSDTVAASDVSGSKLAVLCGTDDAYVETGETAVKALKAAGVTRVLVAGRPANSEALTAAGVDGFIYAGCDLASALSDALGVFQ
jgi:methylmalonyl-CoA mutase